MSIRSFKINKNWNAIELISRVNVQQFMNKWIFFISIALISCSTEVEKNELLKNEEVVAKKDTVVIIEKVEIPIDTVVYFKVGLRVVYSKAYCNGARPSDEMLDELYREKNYYLSEIKIRNMDNGEERLLVTDRMGKISDSLPRGIYQVFLTPNFFNELEGVFNPKCKLVLDKPIYNFKLHSNYLDKISHRFECDPCDPNSRKRP